LTINKKSVRIANIFRWKSTVILRIGGMNMYEETKSSIDWKGLFLKVLIIFLIVLIGVKGYSILKGNDSKKE